MEFGFGFGFSVMSVLFPVVFVGVLVIILVVAVRGLMQWRDNNHSPILTVDARVTAKRTDVSTHMHDEHHHHSTWYYATFQVDSGDRIEFSIPDGAFGMLAEGDTGRLTFQGTRYLGFERL